MGTFAYISSLINSNFLSQCDLSKVINFFEYLLLKLDAPDLRFLNNWAQAQFRMTRGFARGPNKAQRELN